MGSAEPEFDSWFEHELVCPDDHSEIRRVGEELICDQDHRYPILYGVPIMLRTDSQPTMPKAFTQTLRGELERTPPGLGLNSPSDDSNKNAIDPFVQQNISGICGKRIYGRLTGRLTAYPIPDRLELPEAKSGELLLDVGCNWGRWSIAAARLGYVPVGIDPQLEAVLAARRVANQLGVEGHFVVGDARYLPFRRGRFDVVHSYAVLQHFSKANSKMAISEMGRVLTPGGTALVQMAAAHGVIALWRRSKYLLRNRNFEDPGGFEVRHWSPKEIRQTFRAAIGPTSVSADAYFLLLPHPGDLHSALSAHHRVVIWISERLRMLSNAFSPLAYAADSFLVTSSREAVASAPNDGLLTS